MSVALTRRVNEPEYVPLEHPVDRLVKSIGELMQATVPGGFEILTKIFPLSDVEHVWAAANGMPRIVFKMP